MHKFTEIKHLKYKNKITYNLFKKKNKYLHSKLHLKALF